MPGHLTRRRLRFALQLLGDQPGDATLETVENFLTAAWWRWSPGRRARLLLGGAGRGWHHAAERPPRARLRSPRCAASHRGPRASAARLPAHRPGVQRARWESRCPAWCSHPALGRQPAPRLQAHRRPRRASPPAAQGTARLPAHLGDLAGGHRHPVAGHRPPADHGTSRAAEDRGSPMGMSTGTRPPSCGLGSPRCSTTAWPSRALVCVDQAWTTEATSSGGDPEAARS
jgi:hypothetical protein